MMRKLIPPIAPLLIAVLSVPLQAQDTGWSTDSLREGDSHAGIVDDAGHADDTLDVHVTEIPRAAEEMLTFPTPDDPRRPLMVLDPRLENRIRTMAARSLEFSEALETLRDHRFPLLVGSIAQVEEVLPELRRYRFDGAGAAWIFSDRLGRPVAAAVTLNLPKIIIRNRVLGEDPGRLRRMIDLHLAHEIFAHLTPVVATGDLDHPCRFDPDPNAPPAVQRRSCVMRREAEVLADLGYEPRESYLWDYWEEELDPSGG